MNPNLNEKDLYLIFILLVMTAPLTVKIISHSSFIVEYSAISDME